MSFDKNYPNRKDHRKPYKGAKACDRSCRNHGSCDYCKSNRLIQYNKEQQKARHELNEALEHEFFGSDPRNYFADYNYEFEKWSNRNNPEWMDTYEDRFQDDEQWWNSLDDNQKSSFFRKEMEEYEQYINSI